MKELAYNLWTNKTTASKFWVAIIGGLGVAASQGLFPDSIASWIAVFGPVLTGVLVYMVPNTEPETLEEAEQDFEEPEYELKDDEEGV